MGHLRLSTEWQGLGQFSLFPNSSGHPNALAPNPPTTSTTAAVRQMVTGLASAAPVTVWQRPSAWPCLLLFTCR